MSVVSAPHDALFKKFLSHLPVARQFLEIHLPQSIREHCDLDKLQVVPTTFIERDLSALYSDVLLSMKTDDGEGYIYALIEHQSTPDKHMTLRMMRYTLAAIQRHLDEGHHDVPLVIPILFYQGKTSPYPYSMNWLESFRNPVLAKQIFCHSFPLVDVTVIPDEEIMAHRDVARLEMAHKIIRLRDILENIDPMATLLALDYNDDLSIDVVFYLLRYGNTDDREKIVKILIQAKPQLEGKIMTIEEQWRQESRQEGRQEGRKEGRQEVMLELAQRMLREQFDLNTIMKLTGLSEGELRQLNG
ncbi:Rpn family recombination-promoting nuclease/putative transposase [Pantoea sp. At-9b]|jgi:recombination-promoting nuclease RpnB|uniref:Rpn family recombination-promoting nuclease/putative transposase n=1 Tax=Pantoea sp. (strain At-9b) TaxID=592316 RepID=UPI0001B3EC10|nr:Rpn family recombination-promoting nuclease/putative transposase [Pantoea sp. At-9b]ADU68481.1 putative transposase YhgA family protein [Pantoea sp. At-9b]